MSSLVHSTDITLLEIGQRQNRLLADDYVSYTTTRDKHWNITGTESRHLHRQFQAQYAKTNEMLLAYLEFDPQPRNFSKTTNLLPYHHE